MFQVSRSMDGVSRCARYAFGPNKLHMCGPDANQEVLAYLKEGASDVGLSHILSGFETLYPYLRQIARANRIHDIFDERVVEAYWIGNDLLERIPLKLFYHHLAEGLGLKRRYRTKYFDQMATKLPRGAAMHHSFHVFNVSKAQGGGMRYNTASDMDLCRVSWGRVTDIEGPKVTLRRKPLLAIGHQLVLGDEQKYELARNLADDWLEDLSIGNWVTMHWRVPCEVIPEKSVRWLEYFTKKHIELANETL